MATAIDVFVPYDSGSGTGVSEATWRSFMKRATQEGVLEKVLNEFQCIGDSSGMQVKVNTGEVWIQGNWGQNNSQRTIPITSNSSGNPRIDLVVLRNDFVGKQIVIDVLTGTPAATPVAPSVTQNSSKWELAVATVAVANGAATITAGNVTDARVWSDPYFMCRVRNTSGFALAASTDLWAQGSWVAQYDALGMFQPLGDSATYSYIAIPQTGWYEVSFLANYDNTSGVAVCYVTNGRNLNTSVTRDSKPAVTGGGDGTWLFANRKVVLTAGDHLYWGNWASVACNVRGTLFGMNSCEVFVRKTNDRPNTA